MHLEIVTPEHTLYSGEVQSVAVPGISGEFQMLDHHAPIVSLLTEGKVKIYGDISPKKDVADRFKKGDGSTDLMIIGGVVEMKDNKAVVLAD